MLSKARATVQAASSSAHVGKTSEASASAGLNDPLGLTRKRGPSTHHHGWYAALAAGGAGRARLVSEAATQSVPAPTEQRRSPNVCYLRCPQSAKDSLGKLIGHTHGIKKELIDLHVMWLVIWFIYYILCRRCRDNDGDWRRRQPGKCVLPQSPCPRVTL